MTTQPNSTTKLRNNKTLKLKDKRKKKKAYNKRGCVGGGGGGGDEVQEGMRGKEMKYKRKGLQNGSQMEVAN